MAALALLLSVDSLCERNVLVSNAREARDFHKVRALAKGVCPLNGWQRSLVRARF